MAIGTHSKDFHDVKAAVAATSFKDQDPTVEDDATASERLRATLEKEHPKAMMDRKNIEQKNTIAEQ